MSVFQNKIICQNRNQKNLNLNEKRQEMLTQITEMLGFSEDSTAAMIKMFPHNYKRA